MSNADAFAGGVKKFFQAVALDKNPHLKRKFVPKITAGEQKTTRMDRAGCQQSYAGQIRGSEAPTWEKKFKPGSSKRREAGVSNRWGRGNLGNENPACTEQMGGGANPSYVGGYYMHRSRGETKRGKMASKRQEGKQS